ncbi:LMBR1-like protein lilipod isoform X2 [Rhodnius prolixus]|uniref:LMBR1-like protein lilipod isoform X2 n=1 Tax=Rhodnius prolixus TaxID=13249 RepID=UPI003D18A0B4
MMMKKNIMIFVKKFSITLFGNMLRRDSDDYFSIDEDEVKVYKISLYLCVFSLSVTICAALLLPFSIVSNEVLLLYPKSYYVKWLNHSLIQGIWNLVFLFSNMSLFGLLPFAYLFTESEGFTGYRRNVKSRVYETITVLFLLGFVVFGITYVVSAIVDTSNYSFLAFQNFGAYYLPFLYSCISFIGVLLLLLCTPLGFIRLFGIVSRFLVKPDFLHNVADQYFLAVVEEDLIRRRLRQVIENGKTYMKPEPMCPPLSKDSVEDDHSLYSLQNGALQIGLKHRLDVVKKNRQLLELQKSISPVRRNIVYPMAMLILLVVTVITVLLVLFNSIQLLIGIKALPKSTAQFTLGLTSLSKLGPVGAGIEIVVITYLAVTSCAGLYTLPLLAKIRPTNHGTPLSLLIANAAILLVLSSALPLLSRILGITNFDLLGHFGKIEWLGNFQIVFLYNLLFAGVTTLCLVNKLTAPVCKELFIRVFGEKLFNRYIVTKTKT